MDPPEAALPENPASPDLAMPADFPTQTAWDLELRVGILDTRYRALHANQPCDEWRAFTSAVSGLRALFRAMTESESEYIATVPQSNDTRENIYRQDNSLFCFFTNALSTLETLCYICFAMGAQLRPTGFPMKSESDKRSITPTRVLKTFERLFPNDDLTKALNSIVADPMLKEIKDTRNILSHRGSPSRTYNVNIQIGHGIAPQHKYLGGSKGDPPTWNGITLDAAALEQRRVSIALHVANTIGAALVFATENIKS
jgi:hypothetical protein